jgi:hypothetical protein
MYANFFLAQNQNARVEQWQKRPMRVMQVGHLQLAEKSMKGGRISGDTLSHLILF